MMTWKELSDLRDLIEGYERKFHTTEFSQHCLWIVNRELQLKRLECDITGKYDSIDDGKEAHTTQRNSSEANSIQSESHKDR